MIRKSWCKIPAHPWIQKLIAEYLKTRSILGSQRGGTGRRRHPQKRRVFGAHDGRVSSCMLQKQRREKMNPCISAWVSDINSFTGTIRGHTQPPGELRNHGAHDPRQNGVWGLVSSQGFSAPYSSNIFCIVKQLRKYCRNTEVSSFLGINNLMLIPKFVKCQIMGKV